MVKVFPKTKKRQKAILSFCLFMNYDARPLGKGRGGLNIAAYWLGSVAVKSAASMLSTRVMTRLGDAKVKRLETTVTT